IQNGDYWRGEIDWPHATIVNRKQVTQVGQFGPANAPILWWVNVLLVWGDFDKNKPIVRMDLISGATEEISDYNHTLGRVVNEYSAGVITSTGHCRVAKWTPAAFYSYDVRTGKTTSFQNKY